MFTKKIGDSSKVAANLLNMAIIQSNISDFRGSELTSIEALDYISKRKGRYYLFALYNNLGITSNELKQYNDAIYWYNQARPFVKNDRQFMTLENNIGLVHRNKGDYKKATEQFRKITKNDSIGKFTLLNAMALDNLGYVEVLEGNSNAIKKLHKAYKTRKKGESINGKIVSQLHLGEYYIRNKERDSALYYLDNAYSDAKRIGDTKNTLKILDFLYQVSNNDNFLKERMRINDSVVYAERNLKHTLAKIKYRTKQQETLNAKLTFENDKNRVQKLFFGFISILLFIASIFTFIYFIQRQRAIRQKTIIGKLKARSEEKDKLALYLHDDVASDVVVGLQKAEKLQTTEFNNEWASVIELFKGAYDKMRNRSQELSAQHFSVIPFAKKLKALFVNIELGEDTKIDYVGLDDIDWDIIPNHVKMNIYSIVRELMINIQKHAKATEVLLIFEEKSKQILIKINDNGIGFNKDVRDKGIGLFNIEKRIAEMGGQFQIKDLKPSGISFNVKIPKLWA